MAPNLWGQASPQDYKKNLNEMINGGIKQSADIQSLLIFRLLLPVIVMKPSEGTVNNS